MATITMSIPDEIKSEMDAFPEMNWSAVAREAIRQRLVMLEKFREFTKNSKLTENDAIAIGRKVTKALAKHYLK